MCDLLQYTESIQTSPAAFERMQDSSNSRLRWKVSQILEHFESGLKHPSFDVRVQFQDSLLAAKRARRESASDALVIAALLFYPCHMLARRDYAATTWNSDSIIETGTLDWLYEWFGEIVAESIRLQPHCRRYIASINRSYQRNLDPEQSEQFLCDGGEMSYESKLAFARSRFFSPAMQLSRWIHQVSHREDGFQRTKLDRNTAMRA